MKRKPTTQKERKLLRKKQAKHCNSCPRFLDVHEFHVDHIIPLFEGGPDSLDNKQAICITCHSKKTRKEISRRMRGSIKLNQAERDFLGISDKWLPPA
jgi:5-methylcytosine-specific restriction endonuclease McrA